MDILRSQYNGVTRNFRSEARSPATSVSPMQKMLLSQSPPKMNSSVQKYIRKLEEEIEKERRDPQKLVEDED